MPVTPPIEVIACHIRWPIKVFGRVIYRLLTHSGDFASANPPIIFDKTGQPVSLDSELAPGSVVRVQHDGRGVMLAVQLIETQFDNPFALYGEESVLRRTLSRGDDG